MTKKTQATVTIGIPAYNEAANIAHILRDIFSQEEDGFVIERIIVNSDGSTDKTVSVTRALADPRLVVFHDEKRKGKAARLNEIIEKTSSDVLVLLDADIALDGKYFLKRIVQPVLDEHADLVSTTVAFSPPENFVEKMLALGLEFKSRVFEEWKAGRNLYTCRGTARACSRKLYRRLRFEDSVGEDAYSYLFTVARGYNYTYIPYATARIKLPATLKDHYRQSNRFFSSPARFTSSWGEGFVKQEYSIPKSLLFKHASIGFFSHPILFMAYTLVTLISLLKVISGETSSSQTWDMVTSTKSLHT